MSLVSLIILAALLALAFAAFNFATVKRMDEGTDEMKEIASAIRSGSKTFLNYEYKIIYAVVALVAIIMALATSWQSAVALIIGSIMSGAAGLLGMSSATYSNVRATNVARKTKDVGKTVKVAFSGGSVMGLAVGGFALLGLFVVYLIFGIGMGQLTELEMATNWLGISYLPFIMTLSGYALGCSIIAMFNRVGGGIYTKAADMGADLVGKTEEHIPEDDPRNPATIADNVGDNVGDIAGMGSDLLESFVGSIAATMMLSYHLFISVQASGGNLPVETLTKLILFPVLLCAGGLFACILGIAIVLFKRNMSHDPHKDLNFSTYLSAGLTVVFGFILSKIMFGNMTGINAFNFSAGWISPWIGMTIGVLAGVIIGIFAEYYTSDEYNPTKGLARTSLDGPALVVTQGLALGMRSTMAPVMVMALAIISSYAVAGLYGVSLTAVGMLSFVATTVSIDAFGPISDNAGGIAEMTNQSDEVCEITDTLDSVGNTTAAIGKGFAIGSGGLAALALMISYLYSYNEIGTDLILNLVNPLVLAGVIFGGALPFMFSGQLIEAVVKVARKMVGEVRRQFKEVPGILDGSEKPDYDRCIEISSRGAIAEMKKPSLVAVLVPVLSGFILGPEFVGGLLIGCTITAIMLAIFCGNAGGAWDNAKKSVEAGAIEGAAKGTPAHDASVVGDTVGDPLKDTVGPSLDIFIKIMSTASLVAVAIFSKFNLVDLIASLFK